ncbi:MAG: PAS domain S-box protein [Candidatus Thermoplasmatota archaeon]|nr:PAS domain S-box protein [Candidatus Thermoplasmatota archaeon]
MLQEPNDESFKIREERSKANSSAGRYKTLFEQINAAVFLTTLDGKILEANIKSCELLKYDWDELMDLNLIDFFPYTTDWPQLIEEISSKGGLNFETENIRKDGSYVPVEISISLFKMEENPVMLALIRDVTERKKIEKKLGESEQKYRGLFECTTDGIIVLDARGEILDVNKKTLELLGLEEKDVIDNNLLSMGILTSESLAIVTRQFEQLLSDRIVRTIKTKMKDKNGNFLNVELSSFFLLRKDNEIDNFVLVIRDASDKMQVEKKLVEEKEMLYDLMGSLSGQIYFKDRGNRFVMVNKARAEQFGIMPKDMVGKTDFDFLPEDQARDIFKEDEELMKTGDGIKNKIKKLASNDEIDRWVCITKVPRFDAEGNVIGIMGVLQETVEVDEPEGMSDRKQEP